MTTKDDIEFLKETLNSHYISVEMEERALEALTRIEAALEKVGG